MSRANKGYEIRSMVCDWALDIPMGDTTFVLYFNSQNNAELVKAVLEWEDAHPNEAIPYQPTLTPPNEWVSVKERLPERGKDVLLYFEEESRISVGGRYDVGDGWYAVIVNEYETICDTSPRYWMLLPVPPDRRPPEGEA